MKTLVNTLVAFFSISALLLMFTGCDTESADENNVTISPNSATIAEGESISFTAAGGFDYEWALEDNDWGTLSTLKGPTTVYTSLQNNTSNNVAAVKTLTVSSVIYGSGSDSNNTDVSYAHSATAYISHIADPTSALRITPSSASVSANDTVTFTASGGSGTYTWTLATTTNGTISSASGDKTIYIASDNNVSAQTVLTLTSGTENEVAIITHNP